MNLYLSNNNKNNYNFEEVVTTPFLNIFNENDNLISKYNLIESNKSNITYNIIFKHLCEKYNISIVDSLFKNKESITFIYNELNSIDFDYIQSYILNFAKTKQDEFKLLKNQYKTYQFELTLKNIKTKITEIKNLLLKQQTSNQNNKLLGTSFKYIYKYLFTRESLKPISFELTKKEKSIIQMELLTLKQQIKDLEIETKIKDITIIQQNFNNYINEIDNYIYVATVLEIYFLNVIKDMKKIEFSNEIKMLYNQILNRKENLIIFKTIIYQTLEEINLMKQQYLNYDNIINDIFFHNLMLKTI